MSENNTTNVDDVVSSIRAQFLCGHSIESKLNQQINLCIKEALIRGAAIALTPENETNLQRLIREDAEAFEPTLNPSVDKTRIKSTFHPWGWQYKDEELQRQFREFCNRNKK